MIHWAENSDLVEQFIGGSLADPELRDLSNHLRSCQYCREIVEREAVLREGVRSFGRSMMKNRLRENLEKTGTSRIPWPHVLSAAAMLVIIVGLGIYGNWWSPAMVPTIEDLDTTAHLKESVSQPIEEKQRRDRTAEADSPPLAETPPRPEASGAGSRIGFAEETKKEDRPKVKSRSEPATDREIRKDKTTMVWLEGVIVSEPTLDESMRLRDQRIPAAAEKAARQEALGTADSQMHQFVSISQQPLSALPPSQKMKKERGVPTSVLQTDDSLHLTLFSDELDVLHQTVQVSPVAEDSIIVKIDGTRIGYKVPVGMVKRAQ